MRRNIAVILAGGKGLRLGYEKPKQFLKVAGKLIIEHTIEVFQGHNDIDEIAVVCHNDYISVVEDLVSNNQYYKVKKILNGGKERSDSSLSAICAYDGLDVNLIFHDAVRPLVSDKIISDCIKNLNIYKAIDVAVPATDTIIQVDDDIIVNIPDRSKLRRGQTPQAFQINTIKKAYEIALKDPDFKATDDCGIVIKYLPNEPVYVVNGEEINMKLTYEEDLFLMDKLFQIRSKRLYKDFHSFDLLKNKVLVVFGGSYGIGKDIVNLGNQFGAKVYSFSRSENSIDISKKEDILQAFKEVSQKEEKIDCVINTAGILNKEPLSNMNYETIESAINVNYLGSVIIAKEAFKYLCESKGSLLFFTSSSYTRGRANYSLYSSSKAAIVNFTQAISSEWEYFGIKVNCINPERTATPMRTKSFGYEDPATLLTSIKVAEISLETVLMPISGQIIDIKVNDNE